jgi:single-stranded-DNA-specific exonuclease
VLVLADDDWHTGVIGIVASRVLQEYYRPTVIIGQGGKGSCRSVTGFSIVGALAQCADLLVRYGGHEMAAGLSIEAGRIDELRRRLNGLELPAELMQRVVRVDSVVRLEELDEEFFEALRRFEPCGTENPTPVFVATGLRLRGAPRVLKKKHLKFFVTDGDTTVEAVWWGRADAVVPAELDVAFVPEWNTFRGAGGVQLVVRDVRERVV